MKITAIIQARLGSSRLPRKVLADLGGRPMLWRIIQRARHARLLSDIIVATSQAPADDAIAEICQQWGVACFRGSETDVLDRYYQAARSVGAENVARLTGDCPLLCPAVIDAVCQRFLQGDVDYVSNVLPPTFPDGLDVEVFSFEALERTWEEAKIPGDREHVTSYLCYSGLFRTANVGSDLSPGAHQWRWTVDDPEDLVWMSRTYEKLQLSQEQGVSLDARELLTSIEGDAELCALAPATIMNDGWNQTLYTQAVGGAAPSLPLEQSRQWLERALRVIPGGAQTFSKARQQYVEGTAPCFLERGEGCRVWDVDGNQYIDYVQGLLPNILGYAHPEVNAAAVSQLGRGHSFSLPHPLEVQLAEKLVEIIPCAEMVRFGKNGSDATAGAVRAARAFTGRERIACCGYHGWQDWFIGSTTRNSGVPAAVCALTHPFPYNDLAALQNLLETHAGEFAAVIMEPFNFYEPLPGFLEEVQRLAREHGALLIFDEICTGFHFGLGGAQKLFGVTPDLACFGKAMGNGYPIACVAGRGEVMRVFEEAFFSFTLGGEAASLAAALKVIEILETSDALTNLQAAGERLRDGFNGLARFAGLEKRLECIGRPAWTLIKFRDAQGNDSFLERSLWEQEVVKRGVLQLVSHNVTAAHDVVAVEQTIAIYAEVFKTLSNWLSDPDPSVHLEGPIIQPVFRVRA